MRWWILVAVIATASPAAAAPVYLTCSWTNDAGSHEAVVVLDEEHQQAVVPRAKGAGVPRSATFSQTDVKIADDPMLWTISRTDLSFSRTYNFMPPEDRGDEGKCTVAKQPANRAF